MFETEFLTAGLTIIGGVTIYVIGELINQFMIKPVVELKEEIGRVASCLVYYAYIVPKKMGSGEQIWKTSQREPHIHIFEIWGARVYELVTGDEQALQKTWKALPKAIDDRYKLSPSDRQQLLEFFQAAFH